MHPKSNLTQKLCPLLSKSHAKEPAVMVNLIISSCLLQILNKMCRWPRCLFRKQWVRRYTETLRQPMSMAPCMELSHSEHRSCESNTLKCSTSSSSSDSWLSFISLGIGLKKSTTSFSAALDDWEIDQQLNGAASPTLNSSLNCESLEGRANASAVKVEAMTDNQNGWDDDVWGAILNDGPEVRTSDDFQSHC